MRNFLTDDGDGGEAAFVCFGKEHALADRPVENVRILGGYGGRCRPRIDVAIAHRDLALKIGHGCGNIRYVPYEIGVLSRQGATWPATALIARHDVETIGAEDGELIENGLPAAFSDRHQGDHRGNTNDDPPAESAPCAGHWPRVHVARPSALRPRSMANEAAPSCPMEIGGSVEGRNRTGVVDDPTVRDLDDTVGGLGDAPVVGDEDDGVAHCRQLPQQRHHLAARLAVERTGRLVCQDDLATIHQRAGDRDPLLLAAGKLVRPVIEPATKVEPGKQGLGTGLAHGGWKARIDCGDLDILPG